MERLPRDSLSLSLSSHLPSGKCDEGALSDVCFLPAALIKTHNGSLGSVNTVALPCLRASLRNIQQGFSVGQPRDI